MVGDAGGKAKHGTLSSKAAPKRRFDSIFFINTGVVTAYAPDGHVKWQVPTSATWTDPGPPTAATAAASTM